MFTHKDIIFVRILECKFVGEAYVVSGLARNWTVVLLKQCLDLHMT